MILYCFYPTKNISLLAVSIQQFSAQVSAGGEAQHYGVKAHILFIIDWALPFFFKC
jgi:hypothetical protein